MCGIFFTNNVNEIQDYPLKAKHRGPDNTRTIIIHGKYLCFHRLSINGINDESNQPLVHNGIYLICNGEIYNYKYLFEKLNITQKTNSDCEIILHLYLIYGDSFIDKLDGVFAFVLYDSNNKKTLIGRDPLGIRPLFSLTVKNHYYFSSELKQIPNFGEIKQFKPGSFVTIEDNCINEYIYYKLPTGVIDLQGSEFLTQSLEFYLFDVFENAVKKRVENTDRKVGCLLSGGLDSSTVAAVASKYIENLNTFSIGFKDSPDLINARIVANHINSVHHEIIVTEETFFNAIPDVIKMIESYDTTTVRASVGNYLICKYIRESTDCKVILNGDGADELMGGYLYIKNAPNEIEFDNECRRLLCNIHMFDVLRSDRCTAGNGLEARTPFLDKNFVQYYLTLPISARFTKIEKWIFRSVIKNNLLPHEIIWRTKEAFSDGVSKIERSWFTIIHEKLENYICNDIEYTHNKPRTNEQKYYRDLFNEYYTNQDKIIPYFWMPKYTVDVSDPSARKL